MAADYAAQANSIYDPQQQADKTQAEAGYQSNLAGFTTQQASADQAYNDALAQNAKQLNAQNDRTNFATSRAGLATSGLAANMLRLNGVGAQDNATKISQARASKLSDIASRRQGMTLKYNADMGALSSKYQGDKANYVATHQTADAKELDREQRLQEQFAQQNQLADRRASGKGPNAQERQATINGFLNKAFDGYSSSNVKQHGYTENVVIKKLQDDYNLSPTEARKAAYDYRKTAFNE